MTRKHTSKLNGIERFLLVLAVVIAYAGFTIYQYGLAQGLSVTALTWAFFVFATPIADGGFVLAFPIRLITGFRMLYTQIIVWVVGAVMVAGFMLSNPGVFQTTGVLQLFYHILTTPWPLGIILVLSAVGTYLNIIFDDEVIDVASSENKQTSLRKNRKKLYFNIAILALTVLMYIVLLQVTGTTINFL